MRVTWVNSSSLSKLVGEAWAIAPSPRPSPRERGEAPLAHHPLRLVAGLTLHSPLITIISCIWWQA